MKRDRNWTRTSLAHLSATCNKGKTTLCRAASHPIAVRRRRGAAKTGEGRRRRANTSGDRRHIFAAGCRHLSKSIHARWPWFAPCLTQAESKSVAFDTKLNKRRKIGKNSSVAESMHVMGCLLSFISQNSLSFPWASHPKTSLRHFLSGSCWSPCLTEIQNSEFYRFF